MRELSTQHGVTTWLGAKKWRKYCKKCELRTRHAVTASLEAQI